MHEFGILRPRAFGDELILELIRGSSGTLTIVQGLCFWVSLEDLLFPSRGAILKLLRASPVGPCLHAFARAWGFNVFFPSENAILELFRGSPGPSCDTHGVITDTTVDCRVALESGVRRSPLEFRTLRWVLGGAPDPPGASKPLLSLRISIRNRYFFDPRPLPIRPEAQNRYFS